MTGVDVVAEAGGAECRPRTVEEIRADVRVRQQRRTGARMSWPPDLLADLWRLPEAAPFLAEGTVRAVYVFLQKLRVSQREIVRMVEQQQSEISEILAGRQVHSVPVLARIASGLCLPPGVFGLAVRPPDPVSAASAVVVSSEAADSRTDEQAEVVGTAPMGVRPVGRVPHCLTCRCGTPLVAPRHGTVGPPRWTGEEMRGLRLCVHMSLRQFAAAMGVSDRSVSKWESGGRDSIPREDSQAAADRLLSRALPMQRDRFAAWLTDQHTGPVAAQPVDTPTGGCTTGQGGSRVNGHHGTPPASRR